jgi:hypothetical protein
MNLGFGHNFDAQNAIEIWVLLILPHLCVGRQVSDLEPSGITQFEPPHFSPAEKMNPKKGKQLTLACHIRVRARTLVFGFPIE